LATIVDVALAAGVSRGTASNVFSHPERVRQPLRDRVLAAADKLGYAGPNPKVRFLKGGKLKAIGVTPPGAYGIEAAFANPYLREFLRGVAQVCDERGSSLTLVTGVGEDNTWGIRNAVVDGFIVHRFEEAALLEARRRRLPCVFVDMDGDIEASSVRIDDHAGARAAATHLVELGHRHFAIFSVLRETSHIGPIFHDGTEPGQKLSSTFDLDRERLAGYLEALGKVKLKPEDVPILETRADVVASAAEGASMLFDRVPDVTAVLAMTDIQALAVLDEAQRRGIRVPEDLSVVGFDNIPESALANPPLTTVFHPISEKGRAAASLVLDEAAGQHVVLPVRLIVRSSTAAPPATRSPLATRRGKPRSSRRP
jgi:DNA-binding LacI/PurR family transcriptional regulator